MDTLLEAQAARAAVNFDGLAARAAENIDGQAARAAAYINGLAARRRCLQGAKARARSTTHVLGPAGTEACVRGSDEVLQRTASQSGSRWLRVLGDTEEHITPQRLNHGLAHTWWWRAYVVGGLGRDV